MDNQQPKHDADDTNNHTAINHTTKNFEMFALKAEVAWQNEVNFIGTAPSGNTVAIDANKVTGASPMELILLGLGGCASYDVISILKKSKQDISDVRCELYANRAQSVPAVFTDIHLRFVVIGNNIKDNHIAKAVKLSADKYCSASRMLADGGVNISHDFKILTN